MYFCSQLRRHALASDADFNATDTAYQRNEVALDGDRPPRPQNPRSVGHVRRPTYPGYGTLRTRLTEIDEDRVVDAPSQIYGDRNSSPGRMTRASSTRESFESRSMNSPPGENSRLGASSGQGSEIPASSYYTARAGSPEMGTDITSLPSYCTMPVPTRRTYRTSN